MKHLQLTTIAAVVLVGCGTSVPDISIHEAADKGNIEAVKQHLAAGADVNVKDDVELTPLHWAAQSGRKKIIELLLANGADVNTKVMGPVSTGLTPLHLATSAGKIKIVELLITAGADVRAEYGGGWTSLHRAALKGHKEIVELLITSGADVNARNNDGFTPLALATHSNNPNASAEIADLLRKHGGKRGVELKAEGK